MYISNPTHKYIVHIHTHIKFLLTCKYFFNINNLNFFKTYKCKIFITTCNYFLNFFLLACKFFETYKYYTYIHT